MEVLGGLVFVVAALFGWKLLKVAFSVGWWGFKWSFKIFWGGIFALMVLMAMSRGC